MLGIWASGRLCAPPSYQAVNTRQQWSVRTQCQSTSQLITLPPKGVTRKGHYPRGLYFPPHSNYKEKPTLHLCMKWPQVCVPIVAAAGRTLAHSHGHAARLGHLLPAQIFLSCSLKGELEQPPLSQGGCFPTSGGLMQLPLGLPS